MKKRRKFSFVVLALLLCLGLTACGSSDKAAFDTMTESTVNGGGDLYYDDSYEEVEWEDGAAKGTENVSSNRKLIKTVNLNAETYEFDELISTIEKRVAQLGGYMENASIHTKYSNLKYGDFVIRIPVNKIDAFVTEVSEMSNITGRETSQKDVTLSYVDMESHKAALEAEEKSLLNLLENAASIEDIIALQSRLTDVRYQIESMESQLRTMDNLIEYATINLYVDEVETYTPVEEPGMGERISTGFTESVDAVVAGLKNIVIFVAVNSPFLLAGLVIALVIFIVVRVIIAVSVKKIEKEEKKKLEKNGQENGK